MSSIQKIISGGQTGADQGALQAGKLLNLETGGWAPKGWWTDDGANPELASKFGMFECKSFRYLARTKLNVQEGDMTLIFGFAASPGCRATLRFCVKERKKYYIVTWPYPFGVLEELRINQFKNIVSKLNPKVLNVAGNRERTNPGVHNAVCHFLTCALGP